MAHDRDASLMIAVVGDQRESVTAAVRGVANRDDVVLVMCADGVELVDAVRSAAPGSIATDGEPVALRAGVFVVPADREATLVDGMLVAVARNSGPRIDRLLRAVAHRARDRAVCVALPHGDVDGLLGLKAIREVGGLTIAHLPGTPGDVFTDAAVTMGLADLVLPLPEIVERLRTLDTAPMALLTDPDDAPAPRETTVQLGGILDLIRSNTGHDFTAYKPATIMRRVARRMQVSQRATIADYAQLVREQPAERVELLHSLLIGVTTFFRDPSSFQLLGERVIPQLFARKQPGEQVRVWAAGCASGEEAYSIAMLLLERAAPLSVRPTIQLFATDIDERALAIARVGRYPSTIDADVPAARLDRFFVRDGDAYQVASELRDLVLFALHDVLRDPPFWPLDLVVCRNLMIYLNRDAQDRLLERFHFGLRPDGFLFLGGSEVAEDASRRFVAFDPKHHIYRRGGQAAVELGALVGPARWQPRAIGAVPGDKLPAFPSAGEIHRYVLERSAPPSVLIDDNLEVVHVGEHAGRYLTLVGEPTRKLLELAIPELRGELAAAVDAVRASGDVATRVARFEDQIRTREIVLRVASVDVPGTERRYLLVVFDDRASPQLADELVTEPHPVIRELEDELHRTRQRLRSAIEKHEVSVEELTASNEELHASNEELRASSEELAALNQELKLGVDRLTRANSDIQNLVSSSDVALVFVDRDLHVQRFTPRATEVFNIIAADVGRPLAHVTHRLVDDDLTTLAARVLRDLQVVERAVETGDGRHYLLRLSPYRSVTETIDGVTLMFIDVTELKLAEAARVRSEFALRTSEDRLRVALRYAPMFVVHRDAELRSTWAFALGTERVGDAAGLADLLAPGEAGRIDSAVRHVLATHASERLEVAATIDDAARTFDVRVEPSIDDGALPGAIVVGYDITPSKQAELALQELDRRKNEFLATLAHELRNPLTPLRAAIDLLGQARGNVELIEHARAIMDRQVDRLIRLVDELLDLSRIMHGKIQLKKTRVDPVVIGNAAIEATQQLLEHAGQRLTTTFGVESSIRIDGDKDRLVQVLVNVLTNASKYTAGPADIELAISNDKTRDLVVFTVRDHGVGIAPEMLPRIFEIFVQCRDDTGRSIDGLGIGLNLVQRIVELHGGRVRAESAGTNRGSTFTIELPIAHD